MARLTVGILLFDGFELLDVYGPAELWARAFDLQLVAASAGPVASAQGPKSVAEASFADGRLYDILLVPGGIGTRREAGNEALLEWLRRQSQTAQYVTSVCTGAALLARAGLLDGRRATSNKYAFEWVVSQGPGVDWVRQARWCEDGKFWTSSGVSAGMDMAVALLARACGAQAAHEAATFAEYDPHEDPDWDPFAKVHGLV